MVAPLAPAGTGSTKASGQRERVLGLPMPVSGHQVRRAGVSAGADARWSAGAGSTNRGSAVGGQIASEAAARLSVRAADGVQPVCDHRREADSRAAADDVIERRFRPEPRRWPAACPSAASAAESGACRRQHDRPSASASQRRQQSSGPMPRSRYLAVTRSSPCVGASVPQIDASAYARAGTPRHGQQHAAAATSGKLADLPDRPHHRRMNEPTAPPATEKQDFIRQIVREDLASGRHAQVATRFPPEPNGYLHIGHAKSICLNFGVAGEFGGSCNLRFDDTNPARKTPSTSRRSRTTCAGWASTGHDLRHASDYFEVFYRSALKLIEDGKAFVCDLSAEQVREYRGTLTEPGPQLAVPRPQRRREPRPVPAHARRRVPRRRAHAAREDRHGQRQHQPARPGDLPHPHVEHQNTGDAWPIYPMYDYAHCISRRGRGHHPFAVHAGVRGPPPAVRLVRGQHRPAARIPQLWQPLLDAGLPTEVGKPRQIEFSRLNINYTGDEQAQAAWRWCRTAWSTAGTIRACRPCRACAAAATRRRRCACWPTASASASRTR